MTTLLHEIEAMADIQQRTAETLKRTDAARKADLVALRRQFAIQLTHVASAIERDPKLAADPALASTFRNRFSKMRATLAEHQARFPAVMLDEVGEEYHRSAKTVVASNHDFLDWARSVLK